MYIRTTDIFKYFSKFKKKRKKETDILEVLLEIIGVLAKTRNVKSIIARKLSRKMRWIVVRDWTKPARPVRTVPRAGNSFFTCETS
jgi:hypothetical protein